MASNSLANYLNTVIYKIHCLNEEVKDIYIGHTTCFYQRCRLHKSCCNNQNAKEYNYKIYKTIRENGGWENWNVIIIEKYPCASVNEAKEREGYWIQKLSSTLNVTIPNRTRKEYNKIYQTIFKEKIAEKAKVYRKINIDKIKKYLEIHSEKIKQKKNDWYEENKDFILEKAKKNYEENKEKKLEYQKEYAENNQEKIKEYLKEYQEKNKDTISEKNKIYRETHKEELAEKNKLWRENHKEEIKEKQKEIFVCDCGHSYTFGNKIRHLQSKNHVEFKEKLYNNECEKEEQSQMLEEDKASNIQEQFLLKKRFQKEYREKNAESIKNIKKKYNDSHKEKTKEFSKKYYEENKEKILGKTKKYSQENKEKTKVCKDEWYRLNKEKILSKQKEVYTCECGSIVRVAGRAEHNRSTKHSTFLTTL